MKSALLPWTFMKTCFYSVDSISNPHASSKGSGMYFEFLLRRAHSRSRVDLRYWSGVSLYSFTTCSNSVTVGTIGPIGSGFPQFGLPRRFAMKYALAAWFCNKLDSDDSAKDSESSHPTRQTELDCGNLLRKMRVGRKLSDFTQPSPKVNNHKGPSPYLDENSSLTVGLGRPSCAGGNDSPRRRLLA